MKKVFYWIAIIVVIMLAATGINKMRYVYHLYGGLSVGGGSARYDANDPNETIDSIRVIDGTLYVYSGEDTLNYYVPVVNQTELFDVAMKLYPDSLFVTTVEFRPQLTHVNTYIRCNHATQTKVFLPPDSTVNFPIGSTLNFKNDGAGIVTFYESNSVIESKLDSISIENRNGWATAIKRAANKWDLLGDLQD